jgi:GxxExxY protein
MLLDSCSGWALELEFGDRGIPFRPQAAMPVFYKGRRLKASYRDDFVCYEGIIVELKALTKVGEIECAQVLSKRVATKEAS